MELMSLQTEALHLLVAHLASGRVFSAIQSADDHQSLGGGRFGDEIDDGLIVSQRLAAPVRRDEREQPVLDLVPFTGAWREVTNGNAQSSLIGQLLQFRCGSGLRRS